MRFHFLSSIIAPLHYSVKISLILIFDAGWQSYICQRGFAFPGGSSYPLICLARGSEIYMCFQQVAAGSSLSRGIPRVCSIFIMCECIYVYAFLVHDQLLSYYFFCYMYKINDYKKCIVHTKVNLGKFNVCLGFRECGTYFTYFQI